MLMQIAVVCCAELSSWWTSQRAQQINSELCRPGHFVRRIIVILGRIFRHPSHKITVASLTTLSSRAQSRWCKSLPSFITAEIVTHSLATICTNNAWYGLCRNYVRLRYHFSRLWHRLLTTKITIQLRCTQHIIQGSTCQLLDGDTFAPLQADFNKWAWSPFFTPVALYVLCYQCAFAHSFDHGQQTE